MFDKKWIALLTFALVAVLMTGCELAQLPQATPTTEIESLVTPSPTTPATPSLTPTDTLVPQIEPPTNTPLPGTPLPTNTETPTPDPYATYIIQPGDTMNYIIQLPPWNYRSDFVVNEIMRLNPFIQNANNLPAGASMLIPLPTATATPEDFALTASAQPSAPQISLPNNAEIIQVTVQEGQTIIGIAQSNSTTLAIVATLNPQLTFSNCDFSNPSGGPDCNVLLPPDAVVNVPALTPTPTLSPTISGSETPTPTPTYAAPMLVYPPQDAVASARSIRLQWVSIGELKNQEVYLVEINDETAGTKKIDVTHSTSYAVPDELIPSDGQPHSIQWRVSVAAPNEQGQYRFIGAEGNWRHFTWQSR